MNEPDIDALIAVLAASLTSLDALMTAIETRLTAIESRLGVIVQSTKPGLPVYSDGEPVSIGDRVKIDGESGSVEGFTSSPLTVYVRPSYGTLFAANCADLRKM